MADVDYDDFGAGAQGPALAARPGHYQRYLHIAGALSSLALVVGLGVWGYRIAVRDVSGVPVVRALEGPLRIAPENPGGKVALHQGLAVNDVAEAGSAAPVAERIALAPRVDGLSEEDQPGLALPAAAPAGQPDPGAEAGSDLQALANRLATAVPALPEASAPRVVTPPPVVADAGAAAPPVDDPETSVAETTSGDVLSEFATTPDPTAGLPAEALAAAETPAADAGVVAEELAEAGAPVPGGVGTSLRPMARPAALAAVAAVEPVSASATAPVAVKEIDPATLPAGERLVQLGAYDDVEAARADWARLTTRFGDLMAGKAMVVQSAQSGGRAFYRLRAQGFENEDDARRFCAALLAENAACIPVAHR